MKFKTASEILACINLPNLVLAILGLHKVILKPPFECHGGAIVIGIINPLNPIDSSMTSVSVGEPGVDMTSYHNIASINFGELSDRRINGKAKEVASSTRIQKWGAEHVNPLRAGCIVAFDETGREIYISFAGTGSNMADEALSYVLARRLGFQLPPYENSVYLHTADGLTQKVVAL